MNLKKLCKIKDAADMLENFQMIDYDGLKTIRSVPENYWVATVQPNGKLKFDSWDAAIKGRVDEAKLTKMWQEGKIKKFKTEYVSGVPKYIEVK
jgi:hypothetical protein